MQQRTHLGLALLWTCLLYLAGPITGQQGPGVLTNVVSKEPLTPWLELQGAYNDTLLVYQLSAEVRLLGSRFVPFSAAVQQVVIQAFQDTLLPRLGPVQLTSYKEVFPDPAAPPAIRDPAPCTEFGFTIGYVVRNSSAEASLSAQQDLEGLPTGNLTAQSVQAMAHREFRGWVNRLASIGPWPEVNSTGGLQVLHAVLDTAEGSLISGGYVLHPLLLVEASLNVALLQPPGAEGALPVVAASAIVQAVEVAVVDKVGTMVRVVNSTAGPEAQGILRLEVTMWACRKNATVASPECEQQVLTEVLRQMLSSQQAQQQWREAGVNTVTLSSVSQSLSPSAPTLTPAQEPPGAMWQPWHLDRVNQRALPLDDKYTATATGTGVNVYIISSGIRGDHVEFKAMGGGQASRVRPAWGYLGLPPLEDCQDHTTWMGYGTMAASLCCGQLVGAAKNATIHSVRFRENCTTDAVYWSAGALPSAMDLVLSTYVEPAVAIIDTWWAPGRVFGDEAATINATLSARLDRFGEANITVVAGAGPGFNLGSPCNNIIAAHPAVISVAASDSNDQAVAFGPRDSPCIDLWAPSGGLGVGITGASPAGRTNYSRIINRAFGAAAVVAGMAAQYLQLHPTATPAEVRRVLLSGATPGVVVEAGPNTRTTSLAYTNLTQPSAPAAPGGGGAGLGTGAVVGIVVGCAAALALALLAAWAYRRRRKAVTGAQKPLVLDSSGWEVGADEIEVCKHPDGTDWLLGEGRYGKVYKAMKGGVQVVAVKMLHDVNEHFKALFIQEIYMMKYVSRDTNITQFYGACVQGDNIMLIVEYMEGGDLRNALSADRAGDLQWYKRGKDVMLDIVRGLHFLHANHVIHRDIKSKNILLGRDGRAKLADVGLAQLLDGQESEFSSFVGTLAWAGPEVLLGEKCTEKADIFSLGVVLWEIVTGDVPQRGCLRDPEVPRECPQDVADAIHACMQRDPALRPSARELYAMLLACPPVRDYESVPPSQRSGGGTSNSGAGASRSGAATAAAAGSGVAAGAAADSAMNGTAYTAGAAGSARSGGSGRGLSSGGSAGAAGGTWGAAGRAGGSRAGGSGSGGVGPLARSSGGSKHAQQLGAYLGPITHSGELLSSEGSGGVEKKQSGDKSLRSSSTDLESPQRSANLNGPTTNGTGSGQLLVYPDLALVMIDYEKIEFCTAPDGSRQKLGTGAFGAVYKVLLDGVQPLAAKVVELGQASDVKMAFLREAGLLWRLRHRNIVGLSGVSMNGSQGFLLMELMEGGSLYSMLNTVSKSTRQRVFGWYQRGRQVALEIARGMHYLHSMKVCHFDLKSANVLLSRELSAKVSDVGLARVMTYTHRALSHDEGGPPGTFAYMAPELLAGEACTQAVDIYSFGVLLHELCTGAHPVRGKPLELRVPEDCPEDVAKLFKECTDPNPNARPTAREVVQRLTHPSKALEAQ